MVWVMENHILGTRKRICIDEEAQKNKCQEKAMLIWWGIFEVGGGETWGWVGGV